MESYVLILLRWIECFDLPVKKIIDLMLLLKPDFGSVLGIPSHGHNIYYSLHRLEKDEIVVQEGDHKFTVTPKGHAIISRIMGETIPFRDQIPHVEIYLRASSGQNILARPLIPISLTLKQSAPNLSPVKNTPNSALKKNPIPSVGEEEDSLEELLGEYIPSKSAKVKSFCQWMRVSKDLTNAKIFAKLIAHFWGDEILVPVSMKDKLPELADNLLAKL